MRFLPFASLALLLTACTANDSVKTSSRPLLEPQMAHGGATYSQADGFDLISLPTDSSYLDLLMGQDLTTLRDYSVSVYYRVASANDLDGYGHFLFAFSALAENAATEGPYMAMRLNEQRFEVSTGGWENESVIQQGGKPERDVWHHALYRQQGTTGELYIDGALIGTNPSMPILADIFVEAPAHCWIGRAPFRGDKYLTQTTVADFCLYHYAVSDDERDALAGRLSTLRRYRL